MTHTDLVLVNPGNRRGAYQGLSDELSAIEPPLWIALVAQYLRGKGWGVAIVDADALGLDDARIAQAVAEYRPALTAIFAYGANPSASTQKMPAVRSLAAQLKADYPDLPLALGGVHVSALPQRSLEEEPCDFVIQGEGFITLDGLLACLAGGGGEYDRIGGLWFRREGQCVGNAAAPLLSDLDGQLPGGAWDLLDMSAYRAHNWHCFDHIDRRSPYGVIYTSFGCPFNCDFCCINTPFGGSGIRYRGVESVLAEIDGLVGRYGITNLKIADELFVINPPRVRALCEGLIQRNYGLNIWAYARVDTISPELLDLLKRAGVNWLAYGFESANSAVRTGVSKRFADDVVERAIALTQQAGIYIIANYIFGLPEDDFASMGQTLSAAMSHEFEFANFYCAMAYPGSKLYTQAVERKWALPESWAGYSQLGADALPLPTRHLTAGEVLTFRDRAFIDFFTAPAYQALIGRKFGSGALEHIRAMLGVTIQRKHAATAAPGATTQP